MMGCLTAPFKLLGCLGLIVALGAGLALSRSAGSAKARRLHRADPTRWRDVVQRAARRQRAGVGDGRRWTRSTAGGRTPSCSRRRSSPRWWEAAWIARCAGQLDSLRVELLDGEIRGQRAASHRPACRGSWSARWPGRWVPTEPVAAAGPVRVTGPGAGRVGVRSFRIGDFPGSRRDGARLSCGHALGDPSRTTVPVQVPQGVRAIRVRPPAAPPSTERSRS